MKKNIINWDKYFKRHEKKDFNRFDLKKVLPGYFDKFYFRTALFFVLLLLFITLYSNNWQLVYNFVECPPDVLTTCEYLRPGLNGLETVYLQPGEIIGNKPNENFFKFPDRVLLIVLLSFVFNHISYVIINKRFVPVVDRGAWELFKNGNKNNKRK